MTYFYDTLLISSASVLDLLVDLLVFKVRRLRLERGVLDLIGRTRALAVGVQVSEIECVASLEAKRVVCDEVFAPIWGQARRERESATRRHRSCKSKIAYLPLSIRSQRKAQKYVGQCGEVKNERRGGETHR
jgi:hypothetical protein